MKVKVINKNGDEQWIPRHWLDHPLLGEGFTRAEAPGKASGAMDSQAPVRKTRASAKKEK